MHFNGLSRRRFLIDLVSVGGILAVSAGLALSQTQKPKVVGTPAPIRDPDFDSPPQTPAPATPNVNCTIPQPNHPASGKPTMKPQVNPRPTKNLNAPGGVGFAPRV